MARPMPVDLTTKPLPTYTPPPPFRGLNAMPAMQQAAQQSMAPAAAAYDNLSQVGAASTAGVKQEANMQQAREFQKLLSSGADGMRAYVADVSAKHPDLGQQFGHELESFSPLFKDPSMTGEKAKGILTSVYTSWDNRIKEREKPIKAVRDPIADHEAMKKIDQKYIKGRGATDADRARADKRAAAINEIPGIISELVNIGSKPNENDADPEEWSRRTRVLKDRLRDAEKNAGLPMTTFPLNKIEDSPSFQLYKDSMGAGDGNDNSDASSYKPDEPPKAGDVLGGYRYKGGDPNDQNSWEAL